MEQIIAFVLGIAVGGVIITLIASVTSMLKIKKQIKELYTFSSSFEKECNNLNDRIDHNTEWVDRNFNETHDRTIREIRETSEEIHRVIDMIKEHIEREKQRERADTQKQVEELIRQIDTSFNTTMSRIDDTNRYIDSRLDKTVDVLCTRMDTMFVQQKSDTTMLKS